ncbi:MAG TPA: bifunctional (p)ppGpp synthetase/guanosine-3',5'-bis(diphosphate) 3'-pyrophosphohydrolase [Deltaproteobacteria bacterium]|nr:bifunctional (p)ppGpp synthetase/guanosine-3',5'-bis(diphosphate) 3'-pyrophosphohydrolase [Deltaproteobacteria bacterium]
MPVRINDIIDEISTYVPDSGLRLVEKAYVFSARVHQGQTRLNGEPYLNHPLEVAYIVAQMRLDVVSVAAALLHDTIEDSLTKREDIKAEFGEEVASVVDGLTKISRIDFRSEEEKQAENFRKMILAMSKDLRVLLIKLIDRLHNMRTLAFHTRQNQLRIARETLDIYAPLANRLGIHWLQTELENLSFMYLEPEDYRILKAKMDSIAREKEDYLRNFMARVRLKLEEAGIKSDIKSRIKHIYSVYQKLKRQNISLSNVYDVLGIRIIVDTEAECYAALGVIHGSWKPIQQRIKDFIAQPKPNGYKSLHTTVIGPGGDRIEIQIRTREMDSVANDGIAAHWLYKDYAKTHDDAKFDPSKETHELSWLRRLLESHRELKNPRDFLRSVKLDLYPEEVFVFTPKGEVFQFPVGATPLDFAYSVHTQLGHQCIGAKVNGQIVKLNYELKSGDVVEILRSSKQHPSKDWLRIAKTSRAKNKIQAWLRAQEREQGIALGREMVEKKLKAVHPEQDVDLESIAKVFAYKSTDDFLAAIGFGRLSVNHVLNKLYPDYQKKKARSQAAEKKAEGASVVVKGVDNLLIRFAKCCRPIPGDDIVGFITRGKGITVHRSTCQYASEIDSQRMIPVEWDMGVNESHEVEMSVVCEDRPGMLGSITAAIGAKNVNISRLKALPLADGNSACQFFVAIKNLAELERLTADLKRIKGVIRVERR